MKTTKILSLLCIILLISSCKQNDWLDWKAQNELWLIQNAQQEGVITTPTGLQYKCIEPGFPSYARPDDAKMVTISYAGKLINGYEFDANENYTGYVSSFVPGFSEGLKKWSNSVRTSCISHTIWVMAKMELAPKAQAAIFLPTLR